MVTRLAVLAMVAGILASVEARGAASPDELYRQGRFEEAEKVYGRLDMDRPRDLRYRYNRGCAAFQRGDDEAALAAFASVLRRAEDEGMRFRAAFNLGNIAFRQEEYGTAADWYRRALLIRPGSEDARHNLELVLRERSREKEEEEESPPPGSEGGEEGENEGEEGEGEGTPSPGEGEKGESSDSPTEEPGSDSSGREGDKGDEGDGDRGEGRKGESETSPGGPSEEEPELAGELSLAEEELPSGEVSEDGEDSAPGIDRKKAEALLDNIREDRGRFLQFQIPKDKRRGVESGKDW